MRSSSRGALTTLFVRGTTAGFGPVTIDDMPLYSPGAGFLHRSPLVEALERVAVVFVSAPGRGRTLSPRSGTPAWCGFSPRESPGRTQSGRREGGS
ncbi:MAG: Plug domain-containing protein [Pseudomonadota bacterium]|nr:Plug domain-containing protein [Pseudomonadota bacterium]